MISNSDLAVTCVSLNLGYVIRHDDGSFEAKGPTTIVGASLSRPDGSFEQVEVQPYTLAGDETHFRLVKRPDGTYAVEALTDG